MQILVATSRKGPFDQLDPILASWGFQVTRASDGNQALTVLQDTNEGPEIALLDEELTALSGSEVIERMRKRAESVYQYLILFGAEEDEKEADIFGLYCGADAYLFAPLNLVRLRVQLEAARRVMESQVRQRVVQENLWNQANRDPLTSLPNRRSILKSLERNASICVQRDQPLGVMMIDLDFFKQINDTYGHDGGDAVLQEVAKRMMVSIRTSDTVGRFGGEEFMAVVPSCAGEELLRIAERIRSAVNRAPVTNGDQVIPVSCSIGVAVRWDSKDGTTQQSLQRADKALYVAKEMGRNRVVAAWTLHDRSRKSS
ncbi:MAG: diguanylate cyclase [Myxococcota bacterium]|nr:diguanylate cyclase [Myxococcota bacterium]MEC8380514.1 diguanylate cyclase [Myxococcota bacterium]